MSDENTRAGGCLCGEIRFKVPAQPLGVVACHCRDCQKQAGTAFSIIAIFPKPLVAIEGECAVFETSGASGNPVSRYFCGTCGSPIYSETKSGQDAGLAFNKAGTLDEVNDLSPSAHFWVSSKQSWLALPDGVAAVERE